MVARPCVSHTTAAGVVAIWDGGLSGAKTMPGTSLTTLTSAAIVLTIDGLDIATINPLEQRHNVSIGLNLRHDGEHAQPGRSGNAKNSVFAHP